MDPLIAILVVTATLLLLLTIETPVAYALAVAGAFGLFLLHDWQYVGTVLGSAPFDETFVFTLTVIPTFIMIGVFAVHGGIASQVYKISNHLFRKVPGGLGAATVMACAGFAAVTGSSVATSATMARLSIGEMTRYGYPKSFSSGLVAISGTLGVMIPPSVILVFYSVMTGESTAAMLAAGVIPGLLSAIAYMTYVFFVAKRLNLGASNTGPPDAVAATAAGVRGASVRLSESGGSEADLVESLVAIDEKEIREAQAPTERLRDLPWRGLIKILIIAAIVFGGIYSGIFTATESGAIGAIAAFLMMLLEARSQGFGEIWKNVRSGLLETASTTSMIFSIIVGSSVLSAFLITSRAPNMLADYVSELDIPPYVILLIFLAILVPMGMGLESISILVIAMPLMYPVVMDLGYDGVWFGILVVKLIEVGLVSPPVGLSCYVVSGTAGVRVETVFKGVLPFLLVDVVIIAILFAFPEITLWLPNLIQH
ncbi:TRAP transporter large permease [Brevibacterium jeotgali]|uniref:TRAP transporter large permease n=1 Tax=Brevibacterium jeotgali TaxID=1262550 RepID=UPI000C78F6A1|nr:TRAP transporter large permease [Brevibacterium jeotgali]